MDLCIDSFIKLKTTPLVRMYALVLICQNMTNTNP